MKQSWRWFGPVDKVVLSDIRQAGATDIVTALYQFRPGDIWPIKAIKERKKLIEDAGLTWSVTESLPISEAIRTNAPEAQGHIAHWITSMENLASEGVKVICYNFMPILDWTRTDLAAPMASGATALRFDLIDFAVFDIHIFGRIDAKDDYAPEILDEAQKRAAQLSDKDRADLTANVLAGLPGSVETWTLETVRSHLATYDAIDATQLRENLKVFLHAVIPHAERLGVRLCCHPDDPPWSIFGLPRIMSTEADYTWLVNAVPSPANGITFCTGSLGARADNDIAGMMQRLGSHVHFLHLRNVKREAQTVPCSFFEDNHLDGSTDMVAVIKAIIAEESRRKAEGRTDWSIPMRPDHGQDILDDKSRDAAPGYPAIGRLKGLAELRGVFMALEHSS